MNPTNHLHRQQLIARSCVLGLAVGLIMATAAPVAAQPYDDATILALELDGPNGVIIPDPNLIAAIDAELSLIRAQIAQVADIHVFPDWAPGELMVRMTSEALAELQAGTFTGFDELFALYPVADLHFFTIIPWVLITFEDPLHPVNLAPLFPTRISDVSSNSVFSTTSPSRLSDPTSSSTAGVIARQAALSTTTGRWRSTMAWRPWSMNGATTFQSPSRRPPGAN